jgi:hypothetical protein
MLDEDRLVGLPPESPNGEVSSRSLRNFKIAQPNLLASYPSKSATEAAEDKQ